jgi:hypothetical protein
MSAYDDAATRPGNRETPTSLSPGLGPGSSRFTMGSSNGCGLYTVSSFPPFETLGSRRTQLKKRFLDARGARFPPSLLLPPTLLLPLQPLLQIKPRSRLPLFPPLRHYRHENRFPVPRFSKLTTSPPMLSHRLPSTFHRGPRQVFLHHRVPQPFPHRSLTNVYPDLGPLSRLRSSLQLPMGRLRS